MSALGDVIRAMIHAEGPIRSSATWNSRSAITSYGYYMNHDPFGAAGDFTTAPEISQMFGELIGFWAAEVWVAMGAPNPVRLIELGPGRGTLMSDALRAARIVPEFRAAIDVTLVETSPALAEIQHETLVTARLADLLGRDLAEAPDGSGDRHRQRVSRRPAGAPICAAAAAAGASGWSGWTARGDLVFGVAREPEPSIQADGRGGRHPRGQPDRPSAGVTNSPCALRVRAAPLCSSTTAMRVTGLGDTLQALRAHQLVDPLVDPGEAD